MPSKRIDAHQHFWVYTPEQYAWIDESMASVRRDFLPPHLRHEIHRAGIDGVICVQARQTIEETRWLLQLAAGNDFIKGVVGWVPLIDPAVDALLASLTENRLLKGVRHVLQGEPDDLYMLRDDFNRGIDALEPFGLVYDILIFERHLPAAIEFVDRHPSQTFVLDHIAKPRIREGILSPWNENLRALAQRENVYCKISGMVTEAGYQTWTEDNLAPYFDAVLEAFGPKRLMFGSDWPVCLVATTYAQWFDLVRGRIAALSQDEQDSILGGTAARAYSLNLA
ncbi:MAG: amidohydrolase family protein [Acidobacteriota bacterium]|nr:amidohydrolase family protein [Acidobacteriota bacterium]